MSLQPDLGERLDLERKKRFLAAHAACHDRIYRYFRRRTEDPATAEDLCAEVFRIAWEKSRDEGDLSVLVLFGVARNILRNHARSAIRSANLLVSLHGQRAEPSDDVESPVREALAGLKPDEREVLLLTYWDGFTSKEISDLLNTSATAIRMRLHRARKELSHLLETERESEEAQR
ncbi:RNA polymerase sigma factor [Arthrobacter sp. efr-133-R2A-120]|uniref:RNA polymerase sigma factor n=1 Tax=Arthrobacter sp. efr-133-R2A-120 TaxID=3040277 RepID=UPI0025508D97|nr:RNA polymerase sigma factor [Arthrobacter sp. efr-133-R2A-120]